jgi:RHS repeat-associated protein
VIDRYAESLDGDLGLTITGTAVSLSVVDLHGDEVSQIDLPASGNATGIGSWSDADEYGNSLNTGTIGKTPSNSNGVTDGVGYGWLGGKQRATDSTGLVLMGERVYNPTSGQFTSTDPVPGGNTTAYAYPQDPCNQFDLNGRNLIGAEGGDETPPPPRKHTPKKEHHSFFGGIVHHVVHNPVTHYVVTHKREIAIQAAAYAGGLACGASVVCGVAVGAAAGLGTYVARHHTRKTFKLRSALVATTLGGLSGGAGAGTTRMKTWGSHVERRAKVRFKGSPGGAHRGSPKFDVADLF